MRPRFISSDVFHTARYRPLASPSSPGHAASMWFPVSATGATPYSCAASPSGPLSLLSLDLVLHLPTLGTRLNKTWGQKASVSLASCSKQWSPN